MIKRTLHFGNPAYLSTQLEQLVIRRDSELEVTVPIEDIAAVVLDHPTITLSQALLGKLLDHNVAVVTCNQQHLPTCNTRYTCGTVGALTAQRSRFGG